MVPENFLRETFAVLSGNPGDNQWISWSDKRMAKYDACLGISWTQPQEDHDGLCAIDKYEIVRQDKLWTNSSEALSTYNYIQSVPPPTARELHKLFIPGLSVISGIY